MASVPGSGALAKSALVAICLVGALAAVCIGYGGIHSGYAGWSDGANAMVVARNLLERGRFEVDYTTAYFYDWPSPTHPEDSFPLLQPIMVALFSLPFGDTQVGATLYAAALALALVAGVPLLVHRERGPIAAMGTLVTLVALEGRYPRMSEHTNDMGATAFAGLGLVLLLASRRPIAELSRARFAIAAALLTFSVLHKTSAGAAVLALVVLFAWAGRGGVRRAIGLLSIVLVAHLPVVWWTFANLGEFGVPRHTPARAFVRSIAHREDYHRQWERVRTYWPLHPERLAEVTDAAARRGKLTVLVEEPARRLGQAVVGVQPHFLPTPWFLSVAGMLRSTPVTRQLLLLLAAFLLLPVYSHFELRYFMPVRAFVAFVIGVLIDESLAPLGLTTPSSRWAVFALLLAGVCVPHESFPFWSNTIGAATGAVAVAYSALRFRSWTLARASFVFASLLTSTLLLAGAGTQSLLEAARFDDRAHLLAAAMLERNTSPADVVMSRRVWSFNLHTRRRGVMIPYDPSDVCVVAERYGAKVLIVEDYDRRRLERYSKKLTRLPVLDEIPGATLYDLGCGRLTTQESEAKSDDHND